MFDRLALRTRPLKSGGATLPSIPAEPSPSAAKDTDPTQTSFPPPVLDLHAKADIMSDFCQSISESALQEGVCTVCAHLTPAMDLYSVDIDDPGIVVTAAG